MTKYDASVSGSRLTVTGGVRWTLGLSSQKYNKNPRSSDRTKKSSVENYGKRWRMFINMFCMCLVLFARVCVCFRVSG